MMRFTVACCAGMLLLIVAACSPRCEVVQPAGPDGWGSEARNDALDAALEVELRPDVPSVDGSAGETDVDEVVDGAVVDTATPPAVLRLFRCGESYEGCVDVSTLATPYLRRDAWLKGTVDGGPAGEPVVVAMLIDGEPRPCKGGDVVEGACRVSLPTIGLPETIAVTLVATYDAGTTRVEKTWMLPVLDCAPEAGHSICLGHGSWEALPDVPIAMPARKCVYDCFEADADADGGIAVLALEGGLVASDSCRAWLARLRDGAWSTQVLHESVPDPGMSPTCTAPSMGIAATRDGVWITNAFEAPGFSYENAWHTVPIAEVNDSGLAWESVDLCSICPTDYTCPRGGHMNPLLRVGSDGTKHLFVEMGVFPGLYLVNPGDGWRCEAIRLPYDTGSGIYEIPVVTSFRMALDSGGLVHLAWVAGEGALVAYKVGSFGGWTDLALPSGYAPWLDLDVDDAGRAHYLLSHLDGTVMRYLIGHGEALSQTDLTPQAVVVCEGNPLCHIPATEPWQFDEYHVNPTDVALVTDSCRRDHVFIPSGRFEGVYLTNLHGAWTGEPVPEFGSAEAGYWPWAPVRMFQVPNGDLHVLYLEGYADPQPPNARIRHWVRRCTETLVE